MSEFTTSPSDQVADFDAAASNARDAGWGAVPHADRMRWSQTLFEFYPRFPGVMAMKMASISAEGREASIPQRWQEIARDLHGVGFTATEYYLLCQDIRLRMERGVLDFWAHGRFFDRERGYFPGATPVPVPDLWAAWPAYVRGGKSPHRSTDYVLHEGHPPSIGSVDSVRRALGSPRRP